MLKAAVYKTVIRPVLMYGSETWVRRNIEQHSLEMTDMIMLRWMMGMKRIEKMRSEEIRRGAGVANMIENMRETRLIW